MYAFSWGGVRMLSKLESFKGMILFGDLFASFSSLPVDIARAECEDTPQKKIKETKNSQFMIIEEVVWCGAVGANPWCVARL